LLWPSCCWNLSVAYFQKYPDFIMTKRQNQDKLKKSGKVYEAWKASTSNFKCLVQWRYAGFVTGGGGPDDRGPKARVEARSAEGVGSGEGLRPSPVWGSGGIAPRKFLKIHMKICALWCIWLRQFRLILPHEFCLIVLF
jgi:hypothetical protein